MTASAPAVLLPLLADGSLRLECDPALAPLVERWLPALPYASSPALPASSVVRVFAGAPPAEPDGPATMTVGTVRGRVRGDAALLHGSFGCGAELALDAGRAEISVPPGTPYDDGLRDVHWLLTVSCALLLGRAGRALAHAGATVAPDGSAWLLVGDSHAGKTSTCATLAEGGWRFLSDDHVVLSATGGGPAAEGWPRTFHLDEGWDDGAPSGRRGSVDPLARWPGRWVRTAPLAGVLFPRVAADEPTACSPVPASDALARVVRQSPWLLADPAAAPPLLALLGRVASLPAYELRLGRDSFRRPGPLLAALPPAARAG